MGGHYLTMLLVIIQGMLLFSAMSFVAAGDPSAIKGVSRYLQAANGRVKTPVSSSGIENNRADIPINQKEFNPAAFPDAQRKMAHTSIQFTWDSYQALGAPWGDNVFYSPYSIMNALGMLILGSSGTTASKLEEALRAHWSLKGEAIHMGIAEENAKLRGDTEATIGVASRFFVDASTVPDVDVDYVAELGRLYNSTMQRATFESDPGQARRLINDFISENTFGEIENFLSGNPDSTTMVMLVNAIYFKALWTVPFRPQLTIPMTFQTSSSNITMDFMYQRGVLPYALSPELGCEMVALLYTTNKKYGMYIMIPNPGLSLANLEKNLNAEQLLRLQNSLRPISVEIRMPRFSLENQLSLRQMLTNMGAGEIFDPVKSDYSNMFLRNRPGALVNDVLHEAKVKVDEEGTKATAATAIVVIRTSPIFKSIYVDRPFLFFIADQSNGFIMFWGRVENPTRL